MLLSNQESASVILRADKQVFYKIREDKPGTLIVTLSGVASSVLPNSIMPSDPWFAASSYRQIGVGKWELRFSLRQPAYVRDQRYAFKDGKNTAENGVLITFNHSGEKVEKQALYTLLKKLPSQIDEAVTVVKKQTPTLKQKTALATHKQRVTSGKTEEYSSLQHGKRKDLFRRRNQNVVIAIDAGHGGKDSGAIGVRGTREKDITLKVSRMLVENINHQKGMKAVFVRAQDHFVSLRRRREIAAKMGADIFISIHADAFKHRSVRGASVYILSEGSASNSMAQWLAEQENQVDKKYHADLLHADPVVQSVLLDFSQNAKHGSSRYLAESVLTSMSQITKTHGTEVHSAGFAVLKIPSIPSVLIELGYLTNPQEETLLRTKRHQKRLVNSILKGLNNYLDKHAPPDSILAKAQIAQKAF